ncbi:hypothetical protein Q4603_10305 [Zobellia galactanivorans]|uniref:hypothetical protein n=1 Tax=Zobellia galactanivorans (strain DSM 12802 / CCUG 47099 / CIP 106680 / NCIMB 13871 / Dsij) TaxID=63186 RepID=UPI0026E1AC01|nr:hypothetical protein [Zobellia galactanivorans]MDO6809007.1 hypothetical protein [Zobellia galactanivorans]
MKKLAFGLLACVTLLAVSCETSDVASDDSVYDNGVDKTQLINGDKKSVDKTQLINGDNRRSVDKTQLINGDSRR